jgi:RNA polymerase sigma-70 factor (ECF subfamily)
MTSNKKVMRWVLLAQAGDQEALAALFKVIQDPLYRCIVALVGEHSLAEDILQEVFLKIFRKLRWLREPGLLRPWVYRIASREAFRWLKKKRRWVQLVSEDADLEAIPALPAHEEFARELVEKLPQLLANASPASRAVFVLHYWEEMSLEETADVLGVAVGTVKSRLAYGLDRLRRTLGEQGVYYGREN